MIFFFFFYSFLFFFQSLRLPKEAVHISNRDLQMLSIRRGAGAAREGRRRGQGHHQVRQSPEEEMESQDEWIHLRPAGKLEKKNMKRNHVRKFNFRDI